MHLGRCSILPDEVALAAEEDRRSLDEVERVATTAGDARRSFGETSQPSVEPAEQPLQVFLGDQTRPS